MSGELQILNEALALNYTSTLKEKWIHSVKLGQQYVEIFKNPDKKEVSKLPDMHRYKECKAILHEKTLYVWGNHNDDVGEVTHEEIVHELKLRDPVIKIYYGKEGGELLWQIPYDFKTFDSNNLKTLMTKDEALKWLQNSRSLLTRAFGNYKLHIYEPLLNEQRQSVQEKFEHSFKNQYGEYEEIFFNPTKKEIYDLPAWKQYKECKGIIYKNNLYVWGTEQTEMHMDVEDVLDIPQSQSLRLYFFLNKQNKKCITWETGGGMGNTNPKQAVAVLEKMKAQLTASFGKHEVITFEDYR